MPLKIHAKKDKNSKRGKKFSKSKNMQKKWKIIYQKKAEMQKNDAKKCLLSKT